MNKQSKLKLKDYLTINKIKIAPNSLDPNVFYFVEGNLTPFLHPSLASQITRDVEAFCGYQPQRIERYLLVGDCLKPGNQNRTSSLKVLLLLNKNLLDLDIDGLLAEDILRLANQLSGRLGVGTLRPIIYSPTIRKIEQLSEYEEMYDIFSQKWIKEPSNLQTC